MLQTIKMGFKAFDPIRDDVDSYLKQILMIYRSIQYAERIESPSAMMGRQIRSPITMSYSTNEKMRYKKH